MRCPLKRSYSPTIVAFWIRATSPSSDRPAAPPTGTTRRSSRLDMRGCRISTCTWNAMAEPLTQALLQRVETDVRARSERDLQHPFVGTARPEKDRVDRVRGRLHADVAQRHRHVLRTSAGPDLIEYLVGEAFRGLEF